MFPSNYSLEQQVKIEIAERRAQAAEAYLAHLARADNQQKRARPRRVAWRLMRRLALLITGIRP